MHTALLNVQRLQGRVFRTQQQPLIDFFSTPHFALALGGLAPILLISSSTLRSAWGDICRAMCQSESRISKSKQTF